MSLLYTVIFKKIIELSHFENKGYDGKSYPLSPFHVFNIYEEKLLRASTYPLSKFALKTAAAAISRMPHGCSRYTG